MSGLTRASEEALLKKMDLPDLRKMALLHTDVVSGLKGLCIYRGEEKKMAEKYGFVVKQTC
jgi:hypothetical protein